MNELPIPYGDYLFIEPVEETGVLSKTLNCYAKVLAIGPAVKDTNIGDYVAFERWDKPDVVIKDRLYHFLKESEAIAKLPTSLI